MVGFVVPQINMLIIPGVIRDNKQQTTTTWMWFVYLISEAIYLNIAANKLSVCLFKLLKNNTLLFII